MDIVAGAIGLVDPVEALRESLRDWLGKDTTFDLSTRDGTFNAIVDRVGPGIDFIVTGHTHLARSIPYAPGRHYFNCGTWIRLLRLTPQVLDDANSFKERFYDVLAKGMMDAIDDASIPGPNGTTVQLVLDRTNAVQISRNGSDVTGALLRVVDGRGKNTVNLQREMGD
jgi:hypothetical protein